MKKNAGYSLLNKKNKRQTAQNLIQDEDQIQMQSVSNRNFIDEPSYAHLQDYKQYQHEDLQYKAFDEEKPMKKRTGKLPPLQNAYREEQRSRMNPNEPKKQQQNYSPHLNQNQQGRQAENKFYAKKAEQRQQEREQRVNQSMLSSNLNQSTYFNPYQVRPNANTTVIYPNQNPTVVQSMMPATLSCYMNRNPNSIIVNTANLSSSLNQHPQLQKPKQSLPMMLVACRFCTLQQNVPANTKVFKCWGCRNNTECHAQYGSFICYNCHKKIGYQYGISDLIRCSVCNTVNQVSKFDPKSKFLGNQHKCSQREQLQFKEDKKLLGKYQSTNANKKQADQPIDDIDDDDIVMVEPESYRH